jgi:hypothetical protein
LSSVQFPVVCLSSHPLIIKGAYFII